MNTSQKAYDEIFKVLKKHKDLIVFDINDLEYKSKIHLFGVKLKEEYGLNINPKEVYSTDWARFGDFKTIGWYGEKYNRSISWSIDGRQPKDDLLLCISFPTGAYIFGEDYPTGVFQKFWLELKENKPDYTDEANHSLYWSMQNAKNAFNSFDETLKKYREINKEDAKLRRIEKIKKELEALEK